MLYTFLCQKFVWVRNNPPFLKTVINKGISLVNEKDMTHDCREVIFNTLGILSGQHYCRTTLLSGKHCVYKATCKMSSHGMIRNTCKTHKNRLEKTLKMLNQKLNSPWSFMIMTYIWWIKTIITIFFDVETSKWPLTFPFTGHWVQHQRTQNCLKHTHSQHR